MFYTLTHLLRFLLCLKSKSFWFNFWYNQLLFCASRTDAAFIIFQLNARDTFLLLDSGNTPGNKILWIYGFFGIKFVPKMEMRFTFRPTEMVPEKKINSAMNGPQNAWKSGRLTSFLLSGCPQHSCKTTIFIHPQDMREIYRDQCKLHVTTRHSENEMSCILFSQQWALTISFSIFILGQTMGFA
jgi:hypothetical protein